MAVWRLFLRALPRKLESTLAQYSLGTMSGSEESEESEEESLEELVSILV